MRLKFISIIEICIIFLSILIVHWNVDSNANNVDNGLKNLLTSTSNNNPRGGNFDFGEIEVISEPISNQNNIYWNLITESNNGIYSKDSSNNIYTENIIEKNIYGFFLYHVSESKIKTDNIIS